MRKEKPWDGGFWLRSVVTNGGFVQQTQQEGPGHFLVAPPADTGSFSVGGDGHHQQQQPIKFFFQQAMKEKKKGTGKNTKGEQWSDANGGNNGNGRE
jgi:hypothetical protein